MRPEQCNQQGVVLIQGDGFIYSVSTDNSDVSFQLQNDDRLPNKQRIIWKQRDMLLFWLYFEVF